MIGSIIAKRKAKSAFALFNQRNIKDFLANWKEDAIFIYPGDLKISGKFEGKQSINNWFMNMLLQFPHFEFTVKDVFVKNIFDLFGLNTLVVKWAVKLENKKGKHFNNSGLTVIQIRFGKITHVQDYIFDLSKNFREGWDGTTPNKKYVTSYNEPVE